MSATRELQIRMCRPDYDGYSRRFRHGYNFKALVLFSFLAQLSCGTLTKPSSTPSGSAGGPAANEAGFATPAPPPPVEFTPDYFGKVKLMHDYWPAIAKAAKLDPSIPACTVLSYYTFSPDGRYVAAAGCDQVRGNGDFYLDFYACDHTLKGTAAHPFLFILDAHTEEVLATLPVSEEVGGVNTLEFSHDGSLLVFGITKYLAYGGSLTLWNIDAGKVQAELSKDADAAAFSPDNSWIAFDERGKTTIRDVQTQNSLAELQADKDYGLPLFSADGGTLLVDSFPVEAAYDTTNWKKLSSIEVPGSGVWESDYSPDLTQYAQCLEQVENKPVEIHDEATDKLLQSLNGTWPECGNLQFSMDQKVLFRFDPTGRKLIAWTVDDWKMFEEIGYHERQDYSRRQITSTGSYCSRAMAAPSWSKPMRDFSSSEFRRHRSMSAG